MQIDMEVCNFGVVNRTICGEKGFDFDQSQRIGTRDE